MDKELEKEYLDYLDIGKKLFTIVGNDLNRYSDNFIRFSNNDFRDEKSFKEICVALGILANVTDLNID